MRMYFKADYAKSDWLSFHFDDTLIYQFLKERTLDARTKCNKQRNICVGLVKKAKRNYCENLHLKDISDNKMFWATVKPLFSNKIKSAENLF